MIEQIEPILDWITKNLDIGYWKYALLGVVSLGYFVVKLLGSKK